MSGQRKPNDDEKEQSNKIDDPDMFICLDYPKNNIEEPQFEDQSQSNNNENQLLDQQADNEQQEQKSEEQAQQNQQAGFQQQGEKTQQQYVVQQGHRQNQVLQKPQSNKVDQQFEPRLNAKKRKKTGKKRDLQSSQDSYSGGQFTVKKKGKSKQVKKIPIKKTESSRGRGKPRGRGVTQQKIVEVKKQDSKSDYIVHERIEKQKNNQNIKKIQTPSAVTVTNNIQQQLIPLNWKTVQIDAEQDLDSQNASIFSESVNRRQNSSLYSQILSLLNNNSGNIIQSVAAIAPLWYSTLN